MRNLFRASIGMLALLLIASFVFARDKADFDKFLKAATDNVANYSTEAHYGKMEFINKKTNEKNKFTDFDEVDRQVFIITQTHSLSHQLEDLYNKWKEELKIAEETPDDKNTASKKDVAAYLDKLVPLRKKNAEKVEQMTNEMFKKFPDKFTKEEKEYVLKTMQDFHDKNNLIKRK